VEWVDCRLALPLGVKPSYSYQTQIIHLDHGDRLFLYTDGVTEARNASQELYGSRRLFDVLSRIADKPVIHTVFEDLKSFVHEAEQSDDITMLTLLFK